MKELVLQAQEYYKQTFGQDSERIFLSPGRINIIGEHVDYNNGYVLPAAIDKYVCVAISKRTDSQCSLVSKDLDQRFEFNLDQPLVPVKQMWANYFLGVIDQIQKRGLSVGGFNLVFTSTVPIGAGMSSSAALECAFAFALDTIYNLGLSKQEIALIGQKAEHTFVGVKCGIMDQFASVFGQENKVILLDCDTLEYEYHNADFQNYTLVLLDSKVKHENLTSGYNTRREEVETGLAAIRKFNSKVTSFRDCTIADIDAVRTEIGDVIYNRCAFVVDEIQRVLDAVDALERKDFEKLGSLMFETHHGLSKQYEVSCEETDFLVDAARHNDAVIGSRMMGGGFGGCTINLVHKDFKENVIESIREQYLARFNIKLEHYQVAISNGSSEYK